MLFNSVNFAVFFIIVFVIYWHLLKNNLKGQNIFLLLASYFFYGCWDWRFLFLLAISTFLCYYGGLMIGKSSSDAKRKIWLILSVCINIAFLGFFKYFNFFIESFQDLLLLVGFAPHIHTLQIILPVGISFYTFHGLSYVLDIYNRKIEPTKSWIDYSLFVSFFPLLVAGPIERATHLLPQIENKRVFSESKAIDGLRQILWGLFKKVVVADSCALYVNDIFSTSANHSGSTLVLAAVLFAFQIYGDFSGYSDIALGTARLLGFELLQNFKFPYFSRDIAEFWRRWHISLSSWFKDYLYIPLGGSRRGMIITIRNTFIIFLVSGFWHGANWTFIVWGGLHAIYIVPSIITKRNRRNLEIVAQGKKFPSLPEIGHILITFSLTVFAWIFFRSDSVSYAWDYIKQIPENFVSVPFIYPRALATMAMVLFMLFFEWLGREKKYALENFGEGKSPVLRWSFYYLVLLFIGLLGGMQETFIYFQF